MRRVRFCLYVLAATVLIVVAPVVTRITQPPSKHAVKGIEVAHAAAEVTSPIQGCAKCHQDKISVSCSTCHTKLIVTKIGRYFPHHEVLSVGPPNICQISLCHGGDVKDVRYIKVVKASDSYCSRCH